MNNVSSIDVIRLNVIINEILEVFRESSASVFEVRCVAKNIREIADTDTVLTIDDVNLLWEENGMVFIDRKKSIRTIE